MNLNKNKDKIKEVLAYFSGKIKKYKTFVFTFLLIILVFDYFLFPLPALAQAEAKEEAAGQSQEMPVNGDQAENTADSASNTAKVIEATAPKANLPENPDATPKKIKTVEITAYNSEAAQCDASPCITANGFNVCKHGIEDTIATNALPFGTRVKIPELFGDRIFIVRDRMNSRYHDRVDIWMKDHKQAIKFGIKVAKIEIL